MANGKVDGSEHPKPVKVGSLSQYLGVFFYVLARLRITGFWNHQQQFSGIDFKVMGKIISRDLAKL